RAVHAAQLSRGGRQQASADDTPGPGDHQRIIRLRITHMGRNHAMTPEGMAHHLTDILRYPEQGLVEYLDTLWMYIDGDESEGENELQSIVGYLLDAWMPRS